MIRILAACSPGEVRAAAWDGDTLLDLALSRPGRPDGVGDIYRAHVSAVMPAMAGVFVALPGAEADGFLPDSDGARGLAEGAAVTVRITRAAQGGKGPRLTASLPQDPGQPGLRQRGPGAVERLAACYPGAPIIADDPALVALLRPLLGQRITIGPASHAALAEQIDALTQPDVALPGGARASIHPTPALVAIDVDTSSGTASRQGKADTQRAANLALLPALMHQIRLRNLSGVILLDLAGLSVRGRLSLGPALIAALAADKLQPRFHGFTALGLAEITRPRRHPPLHELLAGPHAAGLAALRQLMHDSAHAPHASFALHAAPSVVSALAADPVALPDLARRTGRPLIPTPDPALPPGAWRIESIDRA